MRSHRRTGGPSQWTIKSVIWSRVMFQGLNIRTSVKTKIPGFRDTGVGSAVRQQTDITGNIQEECGSPMWDFIKHSTTVGIT